MDIKKIKHLQKLAADYSDFSRACLFMLVAGEDEYSGCGLHNEAPEEEEMIDARLDAIDFQKKSADTYREARQALFDEIG